VPSRLPRKKDRKDLNKYRHGGKGPLLVKGNRAWQELKKARTTNVNKKTDQPQGTVKTTIER